MSTRQENNDRGPTTEGNTQKAKDREEQGTEGNMQNGKGRGTDNRAVDKAEHRHVSSCRSARSSIFHKWARAAGGNGLSEDR